MNYGKILKRAFEIARDYRLLWVFGFLLAITSGGGNGGSGGANGGVRFDGSNFPRDGRDFDFRDFRFPDFRFPNLDHLLPSMETILTAVIVLICFFVLLGIVFTILRYVAETAMIRLVNDYEESGLKVGFQQGLRLGWSRAAFRLFLIDLLVGVVVAVAVILLLLLAAAPLLGWISDNAVLQAGGTAAAIGLFVAVIFVMIVTGILISLVMKLVHRACVLEGMGVFDALRRGAALVRQRFWDVLVMALILFGIGLGWALVMIPVFVLLLIAAVLLGGLPALLAGGLASLFSQEALPWIVGAAVGLPIFLILMIGGGGFLAGLMETYQSSAWTLTYREILALEQVAPAGGSDLPEETGQALGGEA